MDVDLIATGLSKRTKRTAPKSGDVDLKLLVNVGSDLVRKQSGDETEDMDVEAYAKFLQEVKQSSDLKSPVFPVVALEAAPEGTRQSSDFVVQQFFFKKPMSRTKVLTSRKRKSQAVNEVDFDPLFTSDDEEITVPSGVGVEADVIRILGRTDDETDPEHPVQKVKEIVGLPIDWRERDQAHSFLKAMIGVGKPTAFVARNRGIKMVTAHGAPSSSACHLMAENNRLSEEVKKLEEKNHAKSCRFEAIKEKSAMKAALLKANIVASGDHFRIKQLRRMLEISEEALQRERKAKEAVTVDRNKWKANSLAAVKMINGLSGSSMHTLGSIASVSKVSGAKPN